MGKLDEIARYMTPSSGERYSIIGPSGCVRCHGNKVSTINGVFAKLSPSRLALAGLRLVLFPINPATHPTYVAAAPTYVAAAPTYVAAAPAYVAAAPAGESLFFNIFE